MKTEINKVHFSDLHFDHTLWINQLTFFKEELVVFKKRVEEVTLKNNSTEFATKLGHFESQLTIQRDHIDRFLHDLKIHEQKMAAAAKENPILAEHGIYTDHVAERERFDIFVKLYMEFKNDLYRFLSAWM